MWSFFVIYMRDSTLLKASLCVSLIGLTFLLALTEFVEPEPIDISQIEDNLGKNVYVEGLIESATYKDKVTFFGLSNSGAEIDLVIFDKMDPIVSKGDRVGVVGEVAMYKGDFEIIVEELICLQCGK